MKKAFVMFLGGWFGMSMAYQHFGQPSNDSSEWRQQLEQIEQQAAVLLQNSGDRHPVVLGRALLIQLNRKNEILQNRLTVLALQSARAHPNFEGQAGQRSRIWRAGLDEERLHIQNMLQTIRRQRYEIEQVIVETNSSERHTMFLNGFHNALTFMLSMLNYTGNFDQRFLLFSALCIGSIALALLQARASQAPVGMPYISGALVGTICTYAVLVVARYNTSAIR